jgi:hypothetical protein
MSHKELDRYAVLSRVLGKELTQAEAAALLSIKERQIRYLLTDLKEKGPEGLISKHRGKRGNHRKTDAFRQRVLALSREQYEGFGPTFLKEKLQECHGLKLGTETLRLWMIEAGIWIPKQRRERHHVPRARREYFGELIQADGSHHRWFGEDGPMVNLCVFIDDATSRVTGLHFSEAETLESYFETLEQHLKKHGRFRALYVDRSSICRSPKEGGITQFQRALKALDIELIYANSPQAKGRVERVNRTFQDRLLKELRLRGIKTIEEANQFAEEYLVQHNEKFSKKPMNDFDAHRPLDGYDLERLLCRYEARTVLSSGIFQFNNTSYQIQGISELRRLKGKQVEIRLGRTGKMKVFLGDRELQVLPLDQVIEEHALELSRKEVLCWNSRGRKTPVPAWHPWKNSHIQARRV